VRVFAARVSAARDVSRVPVAGTGKGYHGGLRRSRAGRLSKASEAKRGAAVSEQASGTHGPLRDEAIKRQDEAEAREYTGEWPEPDEEPEDETEREAVWAPAARLAESPVPEDWAVTELRSDLARHLDRSDWPLDRGRLLAILAERQAGDRLLEMAASLPEGQRYPSLRELLRALGLEPEERGG
jgi:hypothetical protein